MMGEKAIAGFVGGWRGVSKIASGRRKGLTCLYSSGKWEDRKAGAGNSWKIHRKAQCRKIA